MKMAMIGLKRGTVALFDHETAWEEEARQTISLLRQILGSAAKGIEHVGSTSIRSIKAKPIIDIAVAVDRFEDILAFEAELLAHGIYYRPKAQQGIPDQILFARGSYYDGSGEDQTHFIHVCLTDSRDWHDYINFRDYMNSHLPAAKAYEALKLDLAAKKPIDGGREHYTSGKHGFIRRMLSRARAWSCLGKSFDITVDRPAGSFHPNHPDLVYPVNYGFIPGLPGGDGEEQDVYLLGADGPLEKAWAKVVGIVYRENDGEDKLIALLDGESMTRESIIANLDFQERYFETEFEFIPEIK